MHVEVATASHVAQLRDRLRASDRREIEAATGSTDHLTSIAQSLAGSSQAWAAMDAEKVLAVGGVSPVGHMAYVGTPWFVASEELAKHRFAFLRASRRHVQRMLGEYDLLVNWVDARNKASIAWLKWLGFIVEAPAPFGALGLPFCRFWRRKNVY